MTTSISRDAEAMMKLMAYADGELEGDERAEVEQLLEKDEEAKAFVSQLGSLGGYVRLGHRQRAKAHREQGVSDVADSIMERIKDVEPNAPKPAKVAAKVSSLDAARAKRASRMKVGAVVAAGLALAASIFLMTRQPSEAPIAEGPKAPSVQPTAAPMAAHAAIEVMAVESSGQSVSVFYLPSTSNEHSTDVVVWVDETGEK